MQVFENSPSHENKRPIRRNIGLLYGLLLIGNGVAWVGAFVAFGSRPALMGLAMLAYSFGLRHALDADHIAAIDNVTRKMMQAGKQPLTVGLMFSLGHSTIVVLATACIATAAGALHPRLTMLASVGSIAGTLISALFLFAVALTNATVLLSVVRAYVRVRRGGLAASQVPDASMLTTGLLARVLRPLLAMTTRTWHMYALGLLFGLGFDTATEIAMLSLSASQAAHGMPLWAILVFPALFTAAMTWVDTTDGLLMVGAYGWAFVDATRKLYYNMAITALSVLVAIAIASIEALRLLSDTLSFGGGMWRAIERASDGFSWVGAAIVCLFMLAWGAAVIARRARLANSAAPVRG
jgi:high-affinity nickel-transport protein